MNRSLPILMVLIAALPRASHAGTWCVGNAQGLQSALAEAQLSTDPFNVIKIRAGTYVPPAGTHFDLKVNHANQTVEVSGGWSGANGTCQDKSMSANGTVLVGASTFAALWFETHASVSGAVAYINGLTLTNPGYTSNFSGACLTGHVTKNNEAVVERVRMQNCDAPNGTDAAGYVDNYSGTLTLRDIAVSASSAKSNGGIKVATYDGGSTRLAQLSVTGTTSYLANSTFSGLTVQDFSSSHTVVSNTVVWGNDPDPGVADIYAFGSGISFVRVHRGKLAGSTDSDSAPGTGDPRFVAAGDAHLRSDSILIDSGLANPIGGSGTFDVEGAARVKGAAVDVGAFEAALSDVIFKNGFD